MLLAARRIGALDKSSGIHTCYEEVLVTSNEKYVVLTSSMKTALFIHEVNGNSVQAAVVLPAQMHWYGVHFRNIEL